MLITFDQTVYSDLHRCHWCFSGMSQVFSVHSDDPAILRTLCQSDPTPWCFIPFGEKRLTRCSDPFLRLWEISELYSENAFGSISLDDPRLQRAFSRLGLSSEFLNDIAEGTHGTFESAALLVRNDGIRLRVTLSSVLDDHGRPAGRLVRFSPIIPSQLTEQMVASVAEARRRLTVLTEREREVVDLLFEGRTNKAIAILTRLSEKTIEKHRSRIMQKLHLASTAELVKLLARARLFEELPNPSY